MNDEGSTGPSTDGVSKTGARVVGLSVGADDETPVTGSALAVVIGVETVGRTGAIVVGLIVGRLPNSDSSVGTDTGDKTGASVVGAIVGKTGAIEVGAIVGRPDPSASAPVEVTPFSPSTSGPSSAPITVSVPPTWTSVSGVTTTEPLFASKRLETRVRSPPGLPGVPFGLDVADMLLVGSTRSSVWRMSSLVGFRLASVEFHGGTPLDWFKHFSPLAQTGNGSSSGMKTDPRVTPDATVTITVVTITPFASRDSPVVDTAADAFTAVTVDLTATFEASMAILCSTA